MNPTGFQVIVRGRFADLDTATRSRLLARADRHDYLDARFSTQGTLTYDRSLIAFTFRYLLDAAEVADADEAQERAEQRARAVLAEAGCAHGELRSSATDLSQVKIRRTTRQR